MALTSPRFAPIQQCRDAANNSPSMKPGAKGPGVAAVQQGLIDLGFPMPISTRRFGVPDGIFGNETSTQVQAFQRRNKLEPDGKVGKDTMAKLDALLPLPHSAASGLPFTVPGLRVVLAQPTSMVCWATVHAMMRSWKMQASLGIRDAAAAVDEKYGVMVDNNQGLPPSEFGMFIAAARMEVEPMMNLTISGWVNLLRVKGLIWVGTLNSIGPGAGLHSRIIEAMSGDGSVDGTNMHIIDPAGGRQYQENFRVFLAKYEGAFGQVTGDYFQIRHFR
ncbi:Putative peptidoglycan binding domain protein [Aquisphaera giovannonii]|uniref:Peptidoglycan binding domain protein n=1 Tax=Aquisphaera giovannonii TaxID=406548 RepID=A0A5B9WE68_9BACT|nr:peptidoglycan-binding protein [Aquisphaera giovannonii]QEH38958.1 Putative peptidoglycan binding domain protein [Aquisphaera giovannonii]